MANPLKGEASFEAEGQTFTLAYDFQALMLAEEAAEIRIANIIAQMDSIAGPTMKVQRALVWGGLQRHHPEIHLVRAGEIIREATASVVNAAVRSAIASAFPTADKADAQDPPKATGRTGSRRSRAGAAKG